MDHEVQEDFILFKKSNMLYEEEIKRLRTKKNIAEKFFKRLECSLKNHDIKILKSKIYYFRVDETCWPTEFGITFKLCLKKQNIMNKFFAGLHTNDRLGMRKPYFIQNLISFDDFIGRVNESFQ
jgi:hypothetical protein